MSDPTSVLAPALQIAKLAERSLRMELDTWPKPGLVSHIDSGSHADMTAETFRQSASTLQPFFAELALAGMLEESMPALREIGLRAERAMLEATRGVNTHRGAIFGLGLLCAAAGARAAGRIDGTRSLGDSVSARWGGGILDGPLWLDSHGGRALIRFGAGGARLEAYRGFPSVYQIGLAALRRGLRSLPHDPEAARVEACFALIAVLEDTNLLHRGGPLGLQFAQRAARAFLDQGGVGKPGWRKRAQAVHESFVARRLSPGGSADLLAMTLFVDAFDGVR